MKTRCNRGFTLVELMIVVAIVAILAAIAYPSYQEYVRKSRRADAKAVLVEAAQFMERVYTEEFSYADAELPPSLKRSPSDSGGTTKFYSIDFDDGPDATSFTLVAKPEGDQAKDRCGELTLTHTGEKGTEVSGMEDECWN